MNIGMETEPIEFKKTTGKLNEGIISLGGLRWKVSFAKAIL